MGKPRETMTTTTTTNRTLTATTTTIRTPTVTTIRQDIISRDWKHTIHIISLQVVFKIGCAYTAVHYSVLL